MEELQAKLRDFSIRLTQSSVVVFDHNGVDITELVKKIKSEDDLIKLAKELLDGKIVGTNHYLYSSKDYAYLSDPEIRKDAVNEAIEEELEELTFVKEEEEALNDWNGRHREESADSNDFSSEDAMKEFDDKDIRRIVEKFVEDLDLPYTQWGTLKDFLEFLGYPAPQDYYFFDLECFTEAVSNLFLEKEEGDEELQVIVTEFIENFLTHSNQDTMGEEFISFMSELLSICGEFSQEFPLWTDEFFDEELENEIAEEEEILEEMLQDNVEIYQEYYPDFVHGDEDLEDMENLLEEAEEKESEKKLLKKYKKTRKRIRDDFDEEAIRNEYNQASPNYELDEIRFEKSQNDNIINPHSFKLLCKEIVQDYVNRDEYVFEPGFYQALQAASEDFLITKFEKANKRAIKYSRTHIRPEDMK